ncbi:MAG: SMC-Scp complex subunit ScpB [Elusimicrobia bacterium]|nr:SMC-Scp complex subunit ScpB [Elusimicrobiota bacterium]
MEISELKKILEALLFVSEKPLTLTDIKNVFKDQTADLDIIKTALGELEAEYKALDKPYEIKFIADGWVFSTKSEYSAWIKKLFKEKTVLKLSPSALETLAIIAYKQPITKAEVEAIRGVDTGGVIDTLLERKLVKITGRKEALGRPLLYGSTQEFLRHFGLSHLSELPLIENLPQEESDTQETLELPFLEAAGENNQTHLSENAPLENVNPNPDVFSENGGGSETSQPH